MARRELRGIRLGDNALGHIRSTERRPLDLLWQCHPTSAFVARWCAGYKIESAGGVFQVREDEPMHESERCRTGRKERRRRDYALPVEQADSVKAFCCRLPFLRFGNTSESILSLIVPYWR
jgi:hypothetical protein